MIKTIVAPIVPAARLPEGLPAEWSAWAEEPGRAVRLEENSAVLGTVHAVMVGRGEAWFEGLWVRPPDRGRGLGRRLVAEAEALVRGHGATVVRAAVPAGDHGTLAVAARLGFTRCSDAAVLCADIPVNEAWASSEGAVFAAAAKDAAASARALEHAAPVRAWQGLVPLGWRYRRLVPELVRGLIRDVRVVRAGDGPDAVAVFGVSGGDLVISVLSGPPAHRQALLAELLVQTRAAGARRVVLFTVAPRDAHGLGLAFAPHPWCRDGLTIVEKTVGA